MHPHTSISFYFVCRLELIVGARRGAVMSCC